MAVAKTTLAVTLALLVATPALAQTAKVYRIGFLGLSSAEDYAANLQGFRGGLLALGYEEGKNISIEYRWARGRAERLPALAVELVQLNPDVLVTHAAAGIRAAQRATSAIPIVMGVSADPVRQGLVKSLARPGGNTTGVASQLLELSAKRLELLREVAPNLKQVAVLGSLGSTIQDAITETEAAAKPLGVRVRSFDVIKEPAELDAILTLALRERPDGLIVIPDSRITGGRDVRIADFAVRNRLPAIGGERGFVRAGGLMAYGGDFSEGWRLAARYVDKILKGAKPADLPIEQPMKFQLAINLKTAKRLGLTIPPSLLVRAEEVIE